jgi:hypothetical protein
MSKCSKCQNDFIPLLKSDGLPYKTCDRCRCTSKKYKDTHKEQRKEYDIYYRELNKDMLKEKAKEYFQNNKWPTRLLSLIHPFMMDENLD